VRMQFDSVRASFHDFDLFQQVHEGRKEGEILSMFTYCEFFDLNCIVSQNAMKTE
jgi:hypothetical protein